ncbi:hypothetical protein [Streptomyces litchfieldiae]|uniref:Lipoprotein n=1 Tax=Streptomyces litchfieldiae TaxID=3075543 RepID=A0ABU2MSW8_9ACTN|nr:hypothetical protein [Streptomyces sp. DSM 44938]MDT0344625.1 hypothetical protein [Streptomyces sp. DSM 44938]
MVPVVLLLAACGEEGDGSRTVPPAADSPPPAAGQEEPQLYQVTATVLESGDHGPQLCHSVMESLPPQCGGPDITNWDWSAVEAETANGTTWGMYALTGTWDGERFTLTEPAAAPDPGAGGPEVVEPDDSAPLPEDPAGLAHDELLSIQTELTENYPEILSSWPDEEHGVLRAEVVASTPELEESLEQRFGAGAVVLTDWLRPVSPEG